MRKYISIILLGCVLLTGCSSESSTTPKKEAVKSDTQTEKEENIKLEDKNINNEIDNIYGIEYDNEKHNVYLYDFINEKKVKEKKYSDDKNVRRCYEIDDMKYAVLYSEKTSEDDSENSDINSDEFSITSVTSACKFYIDILDNSLKCKKTIDISDKFEEAPINMEISPNGKQIVTSEIDKIRVVNIEDLTEKSYKVDNVSVTYSKFINKNVIAFYGCDEDEKDVVGYIKLDTEEINYQKFEDYKVSFISGNGNYIIINDNEDPNTHMSSGKVVIYDIAKNTLKEFKVDGLESTNAFISEDGKTIFTAVQDNEKSFKVCNYDIDSNKKIYENKYNSDQRVKPTSFRKVSEGKYVLEYLKEDGESIVDATGN